MFNLPKLHECIMKKVLFILKRREDYNAVMHSNIGLSTGLYNSASFVHKNLLDNGVESKLVVVADNNDIDREVTLFKPTHVIIEALWVVPEKFTILQKLHPTVTWIIRLHSEMPFMAGEGIAMDWIGDYSTFENVVIAINAPRFYDEMFAYLKLKNSWSVNETKKRVIYLPNYYPQNYKSKKFDYNKSWIDIGCFGAVRPLKNHLVQAHAAIQFAESIGKNLNFYVNTGRIEMKGDPVLHNLRGLFGQLYRQGHRLINYGWLPHDSFLNICAKMDMGLQVSFSETFNIVSADMISQGVPVVSSSELPWAAWGTTADPTSTKDIVRKLQYSYKYPQLNVMANQYSLTRYTNKTEKIWLKYFKEK